MLNTKALAGTPSTPPVFVEDVFSTWLYTGTGSAQTITNGIDLSGKGGLTWIKGRSGATGHRFTDTVRGATKSLASNSTNAEATESTGLTAFGSTGFTIGADADYNTSAATYCSWTFREQAKFFDIVTYTGNGTNRSIAHNLGSVPGMMIVKSTSDPKLWAVYHRSIGNTNLLVLNSTSDAITNAEMWNNTTPTSTVFTVGTNTNTNASGNTYVAYLFAHNAGGFGTAGTDNVITCGSYTGNGSSTGPSINLGYEPQYVLIKGSSVVSQDWFVADVMRGMPVGSGDNTLSPNLSDAELTGLNYINPTATGFDITSAGSSFNGSGETYIYMAIRRPMKVPTTGTSVFGDISASVEPVSTNLTTENGVLADLVVHGLRISGTSFGRHWLSRLTGDGVNLVSSSTGAESNPGDFWKFDNNNFAYISPNGYANNSGTNTKYVAYSFKRAPGFFDVVCYIGDSASTRQVTHNLGVTPQLIIIKNRGAADSWEVRYPSVANNKDMLLNSNSSQFNLSFTPADTATTFTVSVSGSAATNDNANTYVAYLFATCVGVSKVGSYTGTAAAQTINCGFTAGARFVLIKRTDSTGDWYVWDTARGIVSGNDPYLLLNSTAAEVTNTDYIDPVSSGFELSSTAPAAINANGGTFIFLAIA